jgi:hypothetical protein
MKSGAVNGRGGSADDLSESEHLRQPTDSDKNHGLAPVDRNKRNKANDMRKQFAQRPVFIVLVVLAALFLISIIAVIVLSVLLSQRCNYDESLTCLEPECLKASAMVSNPLPKVQSPSI